MTIKYTPVSHHLPDKGAKVEWIAPSGEVARGTFEGRLKWVREGSESGEQYWPCFWRAIDA